MKARSFVVAVSVALTAGLGLAASDARAWEPPVRSSDRIQDRIVPHGFFTLPEPPRRFDVKRIPNGPRRFVGPSPFFGSGASVVGVYAPPLAITTDPGYADSGYPMGDPNAGYGGQPIYGVQPTYMQPVNAISAAPAAPPMPPPPPMQTVIEYPNGRFELRGDGMTSPYTWVWIPNPPPPPPVAAPPMSPGYASPVPGFAPPGPMIPPGPMPAPPGPAYSEDRPSFSSRRVYRWTDDQGVINVTDRLESVPSKYRTQAAQTPPS